MARPQFPPRICRPREHVLAMAKRFPQAWRLADEFRAARGKDVADWPDWCYLPITAALAIISADAQLAGGHLRLEDMPDGARLAALAAWRMTQGIYRFDPDLYAALRDTAVGDLPHDTLFRLPEWCVYLETPDMSWLDTPMPGVFVHLEHDFRTGRPELRLLLDLDSQLGLTPAQLHLGPWSLRESIRRTVEVSATHGRDVLGEDLDQPRARIGIAEIAEPILSLLLYLCSEAGEIGDGAKRPANPEPKRLRRGEWRLFPASGPTTWDVGVRLGAALRRAYAASNGSESGGHAAPRPHIRRAHWHGYWTGPKDGPRTFDLRWLPPIPVNVGDPADLPATIRKVGSTKGRRTP